MGDEGRGLIQVCPVGTSLPATGAPESNGRPLVSAEPSDAPVRRLPYERLSRRLSQYTPRPSWAATTGVARH